MKKLIVIFILFFPSLILGGEGDSYICKIKNSIKNTPLGIIDSGFETNTRFELEWKKDTLVIDGVSIYEIIASRDENLFAKQDLELDYHPYVIPFSSIYLVDNNFSLSMHSPGDDLFTISVFAICDII
tara:strand:- start:85 stop:468 length:384 start_codon:yes stop_codon:yes gene_type:complete